MSISAVVKKKLPVLIAIAVYVLFCFFFTGCPIKFLTGIPCPGCGMTRACTACLRFDFAAAFNAHPLFPIVPLFIAYLLFEEMLPKSVSTAACVTFLVLFVGVYIFRVFFTENPVTSIDLEHGFVVQSINKIISFFGG